MLLFVLSNVLNNMGCVVYFWCYQIFSVEGVFVISIGIALCLVWLQVPKIAANYVSRQPSIIGLMDLQLTAEFCSHEDIVLVLVFGVLSKI